MKKLVLLLGVFFMFIGATYSPAITDYYQCSSCFNPLFLKGEIVKEKKKNYTVKYNKAVNSSRKENKIKDVHCAHCDSHTGYCEADGEVKIISETVHKENETYSCSVCKKPLFSEKDLKDSQESIYTFVSTENSNIEIINRSYIVNGKHVYCGVCYQHLGKKRRKEMLRLDKKNVIEPSL